MAYSKVVLSGSAWTFAQTLIERGLQALVFFVVAKLLGPRDFGLAALAIALPAVWIATIQAFTQVIVQRVEVDDYYLSAAFWMAIATGLCLCIATIGLAPLVSDLLREPRLIGLMTLASISPVTFSIGVVAEGILLRRFSFRMLAIRRGVGLLLSAPVCIGLAINGYGAASIVINSVLTSAISGFVALAGCGWRPKFLLRRSETREIAESASYIMASQMIGQGNTRLCDILVGALLGASATGIFRVARTLLDLVVSLVFNPVTAVLLPVFSRISKDKLRAVIALEKVLLAALIILTFPFIVLYTASSLMGLYFSAGWRDISPLLRVMAFILPTLAITIPTQSFMVAIGKSRTSLYLTLFDLAGTGVGIFAGSQYGIMGAAIGYTIKAYMCAGISLFCVWRIGYSPPLRMYRRGTLIFGLALFSLIIAILADRLAPSLVRNVLGDVVLSAISTGVYLAALFLLGKHVITDLAESFPIPKRIRALSGKWSRS